MIQTAKHLLTACCSGLSFDIRYPPGRGEISELAEDFSTYRCVKRAELPKENRQSEFYDNCRDSAFDILELPLRAPMYLLSTCDSEWSDNGTMSGSGSERLTDVQSMDWIYPTKKLLSGSVQYHVFYLGERECEHPSGQTAVNESNILLCSEFDEQTARVVLRINASSIKIIHPETDVILRRFQIHSVSFAAQDSNTETVFSFITLEKNRHICHSFLCSTIRHAERILMALGQAFEVAFQLRNSTLTPRTNANVSPPSSLSGSIPRSNRSATTCSSLRTFNSNKYANAPTLPKKPDVYTASF